MMTRHATSSNVGFVIVPLIMRAMSKEIKCPTPQLALRAFEVLHGLRD